MNWKDGLEHFVRSKGEGELRGTSHNSSRTTLVECLEALLMPNGRCTMGETTVMGLALAGFDLESRFDNIAGGGEVGGRHSSYRAGNEEL